MGVGLTKWVCATHDTCGSYDSGKYDGSWWDWDSSGYDTGPADAPPPEGDMIVGSLQGVPHGVAVISSNVFVIDDDALVMFTVAPIGDGGWTAMPIAMDLGAAYGLSASGDWLYWSSVSPEAGTAIMRMRVQPQIGVPEIVAPTAVPAIEAVSADPSGIRWLESNIGLMQADGDGGSKLLASAPVVEQNVYSSVARVNGATHFIAPNELVSLDDDGGQTSTKVMGAVAVAADPFGIYAARALDGSVEISAVKDGGVSMLAAAKGIRAFVHGGSALYFVDPTSHEVRALGLNSTSKVLASTKAAPHDIAIDSKYVYYTLMPAQPAKGEVHRVPR